MKYVFLLSITILVEDNFARTAENNEKSFRMRADVVVHCLRITNYVHTTGRAVISYKAVATVNTTDRI